MHEGIDIVYQNNELPNWNFIVPCSRRCCFLFRGKKNYNGNEKGDPKKKKWRSSFPAVPC